MATIYEKSLENHKLWKGKLENCLKVELNSKQDLALAYSPGVAAPCLEIATNRELSYEYTGRGNIVAVISDGTAVLGLGDIGPYAAMPVMEGKCALFKRFANINAIPLVLDTKDPKEIIQICKALGPSFGGINLEDISAPRCVEIERTLIEEMDIPVFHDDQHGTAIVVIAALINALKLVKKEKSTLKVIVNGTGAAGSSIIRSLYNFGIRNIIAFNVKGVVIKEDYEMYDFLVKEVSEITNPLNFRGTLKEALVEADVFIGVSVANVVTKEMIATMNHDAIIFAMANPEPEITVEEAKLGGAYVVGTGRSDTVNQVNNVLAFPGLFKGALQVRATKISEEMKLAASYAIANIIDEKDLHADYVIPSSFEDGVADRVAEAVAKKAIEQGLAKINH